MTRKIVSCLILFMLLVSMVPIVFAENAAVAGPDVKSGMPLVFRTKDVDSTGDDDSDSSDNGNSNGNKVTANSGDGSDDTGNSNGARASIRNAIATAQKTATQTGTAQQIRNVIRAKINVSELIQNISEQQKKVFNNMLRAQQKNILEMGAENAIQALNRYKLNPVNKSMLYQKRIVAEEKIKEAARNFGQAVKRYAQYNSVYNNKRTGFQQVKEQLKECVDDESEECEQLRNRAQEYAKEYLVNGANMVIEHLNKIKNQIEGSEEIEQEDADEMIENLNNAIVELENAIAQVEAAQTKEEVKKAADIINQAWRRIKHRERLYSARLVNAKVWNILRKSENLEDRLENVLEDMEEQGIEIANITEKVDLFSEYVLGAKNKYANATDLLEEARESAENSSELVEQAKELLREAHQALKDAHRMLIEIVQDIKEAGGEIPEEEEMEEVYELVEDGGEQE